MRVPQHPHKDHSFFILFLPYEGLSAPSPCATMVSDTPVRVLRKNVEQPNLEAPNFTRRHRTNLNRIALSSRPHYTWFARASLSVIHGSSSAEGGVVYEKTFHLADPFQGDPGGQHRRHSQPTTAAPVPGQDLNYRRRPRTHGHPRSSDRVEPPTGPDPPPAQRREKSDT